MKRSLVAGVLVALLVIGLIAGPALAGAPWSLFGGAQAAKTGQSPNPWAVSLVSDVSNASTADDYSGVNFGWPQGPQTFGSIWWLSTDYNATDDGLGGGSPRFQLNIDMDGDGAFTQPPDGNVFVYIGTPPNFTDAPAGWQSTGNLIGVTDLRYDTSQVGGTFYDTYANALALVGSKNVLGIQLVVDAGWFFADGEQTIWVDNVKVDNHQLTAKGYKK